jgi:hypothetical protein
MKISARNVLKGKVVKVEKGAVNSEVVLERRSMANINTLVGFEAIGVETRLPAVNRVYRVRWVVGGERVNRLHYESAQIMTCKTTAPVN